MKWRTFLRRGRTMNLYLWIIQGFLALVFLLTGIPKLVQTKEKLAGQMGALEDLSLSQIRMIGLAEVSGGIGLILPSLTGILPWLSVLAALGLVLVMTGASFTNFRRKEYAKIALTSGLLFLSLLVAVGRFWIMPR
jgi:uncharacterized membrane protein